MFSVNADFYSLINKVIASHAVAWQSIPSFRGFITAPRTKRHRSKPNQKAWFSIMACHLSLRSCLCSACRRISCKACKRYFAKAQDDTVAFWITSLTLVMTDNVLNNLITYLLLTLFPVSSMAMVEFLNCLC